MQIQKEQKKTLIKIGQELRKWHWLYLFLFKIIDQLGVYRGLWIN